MRRLFWVAVGATAGIIVARKVSRHAKRLSPPALVTSVGDAVVGLGDGIRAFATDVRAGMAEREADLQSALGLAPSGVPAGLTPELVEHLIRSGDPYPARVAGPATPPSTARADHQPDRKGS